MSAMASQITCVTFVYSTICLCAYQRKHQSSASLAFVRGIHRWSVNSPHKGSVTRKRFPFDDVIIEWVKYPILHAKTKLFLVDLWATTPNCFMINSIGTNLRFSCCNVNMQRYDTNAFCLSNFDNLFKFSNLAYVWQCHWGWVAATRLKYERDFEK